MPMPFRHHDAYLQNAKLDADEQKQNSTWNPNASLSPDRPAGQAPSTTQTSEAPASPAVADLSPPVTPEPPSEVVPVPPASASSDPLGELAAKVAANTPPPAKADPYIYFVQAGAFRSQNDAEAQRARLAMNGWDARITSSDQQGQPVYRVRVGPFEKSGDAINIQRKFDQQSIDAAVVRQAR